MNLRSSRAGLCAAAVAAVVVLVLGLGSAAPESASAASLGSLQTALQESGFQTARNRERQIALDHAVRAGTSWIKVDIEWNDVAPNDATRPRGLVATAPGDPHYDWFHTDALILDATARGLRPYFSIHGTPRWAERPAGGSRGTNNPSPQDVADFFAAVALRYGGTYEGLPRVSAFEVWNEVNTSFFFMPQKGADGRPVSPDLYRSIVNAVSTAVHAVHPDNLVIAGGLFSSGTAQGIAPLRFMRQFLCMRRDLVPRRDCGPPVAFDVWSHHPYTDGSPTHRTGNPDDVPISGLQRMSDLLSAAVGQGRIQSYAPLQFWVTEWGWDSNPPDPHGVPEPLRARWVSEALYRMWYAGVTVATWFFLRDGAGPDARFDSGLYTRCSAGVSCDRPKLALQAFRFPFVALRQGRDVRVWGRTPPSSTTTTVVLERFRHARWRRVGSVKVNRFGLFMRLLPQAKGGRYRARIPGGEASLGFSLKVPPDFPVSPAVG